VLLDVNTLIFGEEYKTGKTTGLYILILGFGQGMGR
jgi:hypothetical protein